MGFIWHVLLSMKADFLSPTCLDLDQQITDNNEKAEEFNNCYLLHANIVETNSQLPDDQDFPQGLENILATDQEMYDFIKCVDPSTTIGPVWLSPSLKGTSLAESLTKRDQFG